MSKQKVCQKRTFRLEVEVRSIANLQNISVLGPGLMGLTIPKPYIE